MSPDGACGEGDGEGLGVAATGLEGAGIVPAGATAGMGSGAWLTSKAQLLK